MSNYVTFETDHDGNIIMIEPNHSNGLMPRVFRLTAAEFCEASEAPYMIENPVSTISTYWRKPDHVFDLCHFTGWCREDNYTKRTCLWTGGGFIMPKSLIDDTLGPPDDRIHKMVPGPDRKDARSKTPLGFARAVFDANYKE